MDCKNKIVVGSEHESGCAIEQDIEIFAKPIFWRILNCIHYPPKEEITGDANCVPNPMPAP